MDGGPSQVDTFDPKPRLDKEHGQPIKMKVPPTQFDDVGTVLKCPWNFKQYGESGIPVSDLFPNVAMCVDDLAIVRSMTSHIAAEMERNEVFYDDYVRNARAYHLYLRGIHRLKVPTVAGALQARRDFEQALAEHRAFPPALSGLSRTLSMEWLLGARQIEELLPRERQRIFATAADFEPPHIQRDLR